MNRVRIDRIRILGVPPKMGDVSFTHTMQLIQLRWGRSALCVGGDSNRFILETESQEQIICHPKDTVDWDRLGSRWSIKSLGGSFLGEGETMTVDTVEEWKIHMKGIHSPEALDAVGDILIYQRMNGSLTWPQIKDLFRFLNPWVDDNNVPSGYVAECRKKWGGIVLSYAIQEAAKNPVDAYVMDWLHDYCSIIQPTHL